MSTELKSKPLEELCPDNVLIPRIARICAEHYWEDDFVDNCIRHSKDPEFAPLYVLPKHCIKDYNLILQFGAEEFRMVVPENYFRILDASRKPIYFGFIADAQNYTSPPRQYNLEELILALCEHDPACVGYILYLVTQRATVYELIWCIRAPIYRLSDDSYKVLHAQRNVPPEIPLVCPDGVVMIHRLILCVSSKIARKTLETQPSNPIIFPFTYNITRWFVECLYSQEVTLFNAGVDEVEAYIAVLDFMGVLEKQKIIDHHLKCI